MNYGELHFDVGDRVLVHSQVSKKSVGFFLALSLLLLVE